MKIQEIDQDYNYQLKEQRIKRKKRKRVIFIRRFFLFVLFTSTAVALALSPLFNVTSIEVKGSTKYTQDEIIGVTDIATGNNAFRTIGISVGNIFMLRYDKAERSILAKFPYIKEVAVRYSIPGKIRIGIVEREPRFVIPFQGTNLLMDDEGFIIDNIKELKDIRLPVIRGLNLQTYKLGQAISADNKVALENINKTMKAIYDSDAGSEIKIYKMVNFIDISDLKKVTIMLDSRINVNFGMLQDINYRINFLKQIYTKSIGKGDKGYLDFTSGDNPRFIPEDQK